MRLMVFALLFALMPVSVLSAPVDCKAHIRSHFPNARLYSGSACYCGPQLSNLMVTLPHGLRVDAVCDLRFINNAGDHKIDLTREKLSLDSSTQGKYPQGWVFLSGTMQAPITGSVIAEEGPAGTLWFRSKRNRRGPAFWENHLKEMNLGSDEDFRKLRAPSPAAAQGKCWIAEATIRVRNPVVLLGQTDEAGTSSEFDVISVSEYKHCQKIEGPADPLARLIKGQPEDVKALLMRIGNCNYWQGDWPYFEVEEKRKIADALARLNCPSLPKEEDRIRAKYSGNSNVARAIDAAKAIEY